MRTTSSTITLNEFYRGTTGASADVRLRIYQDTLNKPSVPTNSTSVPAGWTDVIPSSITTKLWMIIGNQTGGTGQYIWGNPVDVSPRSGVDGENGTNGSAGTRGNGFFTKSITLGVGVTTPIATDSQFNLDSREAICEEMNGTWTTSCSVTLGNPVVGDVVSITYFDSNGENPDNTTGVYNGSTWEAFTLEIDGSLLVNGTVVADELVSGLVVTNQIKGNGKVSTDADTGNSGFFIDGVAGEMAVGDGSTDMRFVDGSLKIPATALVSPDGSATPSDVAIYMKGDDANKFTLQVDGGKGFRSVPETISFTGHITEYLSATNSPAYSETVIPIAEITPNSLYAIKWEDAIGTSQSFNLTVFINSDYKAMMQWATCNSGSGWDGHILEVYPVNSNTEVMFKFTVSHRGYNSGTIPEECFIPVNFKRVF